MKAWYRRHRGHVLLGLCALALALLALAPAGALRLADALRLGRVQALEDPYVPRPVTHDDFYLLRQLDQRENALNAGDDSLLVRAAADYSTLTPNYDEELQNYVRATLDTLVENGVIPALWRDRVCARLDQGIYRGADALGFVTILAMDNARLPLLHMPVLRLVIEGRSGQVVGLWLALPQKIAPPGGADREAYLRLVGLDAFADWAAPPDCPYAGTGLYSAAANALVTAGAYTDGEYAAISLDLTTPQYPLDLVYPGDAAAAANAPFAIGELRPLQQCDSELGNGSIAPGEAARYTCLPTGDGALLVREDFANASAAPLCTAPGCGHSDEGCPAWCSYWSYVYPFSVNGTAYVMHDAPGGEELRKTLAEEYFAAPDGTWERPFTDQNRRSWIDNDWLAVIDAASGLERLCDLPPNYDLRCTDGRALYGFALDDDDNCLPDTLVRVDLADGAIQRYPTPAHGTLGDRCAVLGVWRDQFVMITAARQEPATAYVGLLGTGAVDLIDSGVQFTIAVWDPLSGACRPLLLLAAGDGVWSGPVDYSVCGGELWLQFRGDDTCSLESVDLATGEHRVRWQGSDRYGSAKFWPVPDTDDGPAHYLVVLQEKEVGISVTVLDLQTGTSLSSQVPGTGIYDISVEVVSGGRLLVRQLRQKGGKLLERRRLEEGGWMLARPLSLAESLENEGWLFFPPQAPQAVLRS